MSKGIRLSQKHGVNPSVLVCPLCFRDTGVGLLGRLSGDAEAPPRMRDHQPCQACKEHLALGFLLIERNGDKITGRRWVLKKEAAARLFTGADTSKGVAYIDPEAATTIGLYREQAKAE